MSKAGLGKGAAGAINRDTVKKVASDLGKGISEGISNLSKARTGGLSSKIQGLRDAEERALKRRKK